MASSDLTRALIEFHEAYGLAVGENALADVDEETVTLRKNLISEEFWELIDAIDSGDRASIAKEAADLLYVVVGTTVTYGINVERVFDAVHTSNMSKLGEDGKPILRESDGKVLKGPNYREADVESIVTNQGSLRASLSARRRTLF